MPSINGLMGHFRSFFAVRPRTLAFNFIAEGDYVVVEARGDNVTKPGSAMTTNIAWSGASRTAQIKEIKEYSRFRAGRARARAISCRAKARCCCVSHRAAA